jgi:polysaccharide export outer membrane protein
LIFAAACGPANIQPSPQVIGPTKAAGGTASEINQALASIAMQAPSASGDYRIGADDLLQITLYNIEGAGTGLTPRTVQLRVSQQGIISLPLIGEVKVSNLTPSGLEQELQKRYDKYIHNPQVGVSILEYRQRISVIGAVQKPQVYELTSPKTVIDILALAGGVTNEAGTQVHIYRQGPNGRESYIIDLLTVTTNTSFINASNASLITMPVQFGDVINVPQAGKFFVDGAVRSPGSYPLGFRFTFTRALTTAGGLDRDLASSDIFIYRRKSPGEVQTIPVDFDSILAGSAVDPPIEADDIIVVPISTAKYVWNRYLFQIIFGGVTVRSLVPGMAGR